VRISGRPESGCRSQIGRWLKLKNDNCIEISRAIEDAARDRVADPIAWIEARFRRKSNGTDRKSQWVSGLDKLRAAADQLEAESGLPALGGSSVAIVPGRRLA
jgi:hypothetical protein